MISLIWSLKHGKNGGKKVKYLFIISSTCFYLRFLEIPLVLFLFMYNHSFLCPKSSLLYSREQKHVSISDTPCY